MTEKVARQLADFAVENNVIKSEDHDLYIYSYQVMIERVVSWTCVLLISLFFGTLFYTFIFAVFFGTLSMFVGGSHAPSFKACFLISIGIFLGFSISQPFITAHLSVSIMLVIIFACGLLIGLLGPIADRNKPMSDKELMRCKKAAIIVLAVELAVACAVAATGNKQVVVFILFSFVTVGLSLLIAHVKAKT